MESSRRAVEAYWRSRLIDNATGDDDKITPIYKMDEISETLRSASLPIVKEMSDYLLKRLDHKSPRVKQKTLRLIKYSVAKAGLEFRREMQRHSGAVRQLFHYRGEPDPLRGDALNKAVRDTAHEAIIAIFASEEKQTSSEDMNKRIQGFGNTNFEIQSDDRKSFISEVVEFGSTSIRQGLSIIGGQSNINYLDGKSNSAGSYKGPSLRKSLTSEREAFPRYQREGPRTESPYSLDFSDQSEFPSNQDYKVSPSDAIIEKRGSNQARGSSREERLLDSITAVGGVRLQPSREAIQHFLSEALKLDCDILSQAVNAKIQSHVWQVRLKAMCVLESMLRQHRDNKCFETVATFFQENKDAVVACTESTQASLREKANRVLWLLEGSIAVDEITTTMEKPNGPTIPVVEMPNMIDIGEVDLLVDVRPVQSNLTERTKASPVADLLGYNTQTVSDERKTLNPGEDPFAGLSIHTDESDASDSTSNLFSGLAVDTCCEIQNQANITSTMEENCLFTDFSKNTEQQNNNASAQLEPLDDLLRSLSVTQPPLASSQHGEGANAGNLVSNDPLAGLKSPQQNLSTGYQGFESALTSKMTNFNSQLLSSNGSMHNLPSNMMMSQMFPLQAMNFGQIGNSLAQQQLLVAMANLQHFGIGINSDSGGFIKTDSAVGKGSSHMYPDGFDFSSDPTSSHALITESSRKEEKTKAFDFISEHISAAKNVKKVT